MVSSTGDTDKSGTIVDVRFDTSHTAIAMRDDLDGLQYQLVLPARSQLEAHGMVAANLTAGARISVFARVEPANPFRLYVLSAKWLTVHGSAPDFSCACAA